MSHELIENYKAVFIGGPLDWQLLEVASQDSLHIICNGKSEAYYRHLFYPEDCQYLLPVYVHEDQDIDWLKKPKRLQCLLEFWRMCVESQLSNKNSVALAKGLADATLEFNERFKSVTKNYRKKVKNGDGTNRR